MRFALSFRERNSNCSQEAGGEPALFTANIRPMESRFRTFRSTFRPVSFASWMMMLMLLLVEWLAGRAVSHAAVVVAPRITLVVFADQSIPEDQWAAIAATLRVRFDNLAVETHLTGGGFDVLRGDTLVAGMQFEEVISIYLHGECRLPSQPVTSRVEGALGWVLRDHGQIRPFIHVDCARIGEMLGTHAFGMDKRLRNAVMAQAISRVILHEWLHITSQSRAHSREGITKSSFGIEDLVPDYPQIFSHTLARR